jgi:hypothetical protein
MKSVIAYTVIRPSFVRVGGEWMCLLICIRLTQGSVVIEAFPFLLL